MDLATVKAAVKAWEKAFRSEHGRNPTKDDIKADPGDIAQQYSLYRKLSKESGSTLLSSQSSQPYSQSQSQSQPRSRSQSTSGPAQPILTQSASSSSVTFTSPSTTRQTPLASNVRPYPTTPTPPSRKSSYRSESSQAAITPLVLQSENSRLTLKRPASTASLRSATGLGEMDNGLGNHAGPSTPTKTSRAGGTPKRHRTGGYNGPVHDPNPINPFSIAVTPTKPTSSPSAPAPVSNRPSRTPIKTPSILSPKPHLPAPESPFIHATTPRKLREVLEANSLRKMRAREAAQGSDSTLAAAGPASFVGAYDGSGEVGKEITPRTRARKRLRGEEVDDTPVKDRVPRRKRGQGVVPGAGHGGGSGPDLKSGKTGAAAFAGTIESISDEDEFGPSPAKAAPGGSAFTLLVDDDNFDASQGGSSRGSERTNSALRKDNGLKKNGSAYSHPIFRRAPSSKQLGSGRKTADETVFDAEPELEPEPTAENILPASPSPTPLSETVEEHVVVAPLTDLPSTPDRLPTPTPPMGLQPDLANERGIGVGASGGEGPSQREKVLALSEDEDDEWDPEGGPKRTRVRIVPTRRPVKAVHSDDESDGENLTVEDDEAEIEDEGVDNEFAAGSHTPKRQVPSVVIDRSPRPTTDTSGVPAPLLSLLSLHSPVKHSYSNSLASLRARAIFDPESAARLRAATRGQDVFGAGEGVGNGEGEEGGEWGTWQEGEGEGAGGVEGDDDWESDPEGWKAVEEDMW